jgi:hypothetical protein
LCAYVLAVPLPAGSGAWEMVILIDFLGAVLVVGGEWKSVEFRNGIVMTQTPDVAWEVESCNNPRHGSRPRRNNVRTCGPE